MRARLLDVALPLLALAALLAIWQLYATSGRVDALLLPAPSDVVGALGDDRALLWRNFLVTAQEMALGLLLAAVVGPAIAVAVHLSERVRRTAWPLLLGSQTIPIVLVAPLLVAWFGFDTRPKVIVVALVCFFPITVSVADGLRSADPDQLKLLRSLGAGRLARLRWVELPTALPALLTGTRLAVGVAAIAAVLAEQAGGDAGRGGLGQTTVQAVAQLETSRAYAAVVVLTAFSLLLFAGVGLLGRRIAPWAHQERGSPT